MSKEDEKYKWKNYLYLIAFLFFQIAFYTWFSNYFQ
jgi:hypothetical protein